MKRLRLRVKDHKRWSKIKSIVFGTLILVLLNLGVCYVMLNLDKFITTQ